MKSPCSFKRFCGFTLVELMTASALFLPLAGFSLTSVLELLHDQKCQVTAKQMHKVGQLLQKFQLDYSCYPCDATADEFSQKDSLPQVGALKGERANAYFRQLLLDGNAPDEALFYATLNRDGEELTHKPDGMILNGKALEPGENAMGYVLRKSRTGEEKVAVLSPTAPLVICGVHPGAASYSGSEVVYDNKSFGGKMMVLTAGGALTTWRGLTPDAADTSKATMQRDVFPRTKRGRTTAEDYVVLSPEL